MKKLTTTQSRPKKIKKRCIGGPYSGCEIMVTYCWDDTKTAVFRLGEFLGYYGYNSMLGRSATTIQWFDVKPK